MVIRVEDGEFVDEHGRILNLRGVNLGGSSKIPSRVEPTTFVNRPFSLSDAPLHFKRLRACGFKLIRFIITWEAIEHAGPGVYDTDYLTYIRQLLEMADSYGIKVYIDPHQDVWSRWTGGDGAPLWTLEIAGFDTSKFYQCGAALCQHTWGKGHSSAEKNGKSFPKMIWPTNYFKLACATMFTLFWAGETFAPECTVDADANGSASEDLKKVNIQTFLQTHYINAVAELLKCLNGLENIVGVGTMNEPGTGYINVSNLSLGYGQSSPKDEPSASRAMDEMRYGLAPTPFQGMCLGEGFREDVGEWSQGFMQHVAGRPDRSVDVNPGGSRVWANGKGCIWKKAGVWHVNPKNSKPELLRPDYFSNVDFGTECYIPFALEFSKVMRGVWKGTNPLLLFVELPPSEFSSTPFPNVNDIPDAVNATHWYDGFTLFTRVWRPHFTVNTENIRPVLGYNSKLKLHAQELANIKKLGLERMNKSPTLIGECGIPYDMKNDAFQSGNFDQQLAAMDHTICSLEMNNLNFTLWCYTSNNTNADGDLWNCEDLSIYCEEQKIGLSENDKHFIYDGLRAARAFVRPYAQCIAAKPLENKFDMRKGVYCYRGVSRNLNVPTEIFVPKLWCSAEKEMKVSISNGRFEVEEHDHCFMVKYWPTLSSSEEHRLTIHGPGLKIGGSFWPL